MSDAASVFAFMRKNIPPKTMIAVLAASAASAALSFAIPLTILQAYDRVIARESRSTLAWLTFGCAVALALNAAIEWARSSLAAWTAARFMAAKDRELMDAILSSEAGLVSRFNSGNHIDRFRSLGSVAGGLISRFLPVFAEFPFAPLWIVVLVAVGKSTAIVPVAAATAEIAIAFLLRRRMTVAAEKCEEASRLSSSYIATSLGKIHFLKAQALEHLAMGAFRDARSAETSSAVAKRKLETFSEEAGRAISALATFGTVMWGGFLVSRGILTVGAVSACLFFGIRLLSIAKEGRRALYALTESSAGLEDLARGLEIGKRPGYGKPGLPTEISGRLEFLDVSKRDGAFPSASLLGISFVVRPGCIASVSAPDQRAGSAVCLLAAGMLAPDSGRIFVDSYPSDEWDFLSPNRELVLVSRRSGLLPGTVLENIASFDPSLSGSALDIARVFGLDEAVSRLPKGFETQVGETGQASLPASTARLVTIARALARRPRVLVWDGADADLDKNDRLAVIEVLDGVRGSTTILMNPVGSDFRSLATQSVEIRGKP